MAKKLVLSRFAVQPAVYEGIAFIQIRWRQVAETMAKLTSSNAGKAESTSFQDFEAVKCILGAD